MDSGSPYLLIDLLRQHSVEFVVIGGHAVTFHGYVRSTEDTDIVFARTPENEARLLAALLEINAHWIADEIDPETGIERVVPVDAAYVARQRLMMLTTDLGYLDVFDYVPGLPNEPVEGLFESAAEEDGRNFASLEWLKRMKKASNRSKDQVDLEKLDEG